MSMDRKNKRSAQQAARDAAGQSTQPDALRKPSADMNGPSIHSEPTRLGAAIAPNGGGRDSEMKFVGLGTRFDAAEAASPLDDLDFGLPDDFQPATTSTFAINNLLSTRSGVTASNFDGARPSNRRAGHEMSGTRSSGTGPSAGAVPIGQNGPVDADSMSAASPFGTSPFGPGSKSVFLPQPSSLPSEGSFSPSASLHRMNSRAGPSEIRRAPHTYREDGTDEDEEEDMAEFLPSSLHSLLTPEERKRPRLRHDTIRAGVKTGPLSQSVPIERLVGRMGDGSPSSQFSFPTSSPHRPLWQGQDMPAMRPPRGTPAMSGTSLGAREESSESDLRSNEGLSATFSPPLVSPLHAFATHIPGSSLPQGL